MLEGLYPSTLAMPFLLAPPEVGLACLLAVVPQLAAAYNLSAAKVAPLPMPRVDQCLCKVGRLLQWVALLIFSPVLGSRVRAGQFR